MHESESACFLVRALPVVENKFLKHFSNKVIHNYISKFFFGAFRSLFEKVKKWISHALGGERARPGGGHSIFLLPHDLPISGPEKATLNQNGFYG